MAVTYPKGFQAAGVAAGIKKSGAKDVALLVGDELLSAAMVGTLNQVCAPSVTRNRALTPSFVDGVVVNSGCANVATGPEGVRANEAMGAALKGDELLTASTGVIGVQLPIDRVISGVEAAWAEISPNGGDDFAEAILTTDLVKKTSQTSFTLSTGEEVRIGGACKGSGMIQPNMATMLAFLTTDLCIQPTALHVALRRAVSKSFNCLTVDGDTSTSDQVIVLGSGQAGNTIIEEPVGADFELFVEKLTEVCVDLARQVARDGEGATKLVTVTVTGAHTDADAVTVARSIANSPLVKTALFGNDPNWGRLMMAAGKAGVTFDPNHASATLAGFEVFSNGVPTDYDRAAASRAMNAPEVAVSVELGLGGPGVATIYTCDFSYDYVKINAEYTT